MSVQSVVTTMVVYDADRPDGARVTLTRGTSGGWKAQLKAGHSVIDRTKSFDTRAIAERWAEAAVPEANDLGDRLAAGADHARAAMDRIDLTLDEEA